MASEADLLKEIMLACSRGGTRLFRNNIGIGWVGRIVRQTPDEITLANYRPLHAGLCEGSSDLIGWTRRDGSAIFTALEAKSARGRLTPEQANFLGAVRLANGIAAEVRSVEEARAALK